MSAALRLPLLSPHTAELELCGYCPKLCRAACPVSNAEPRDTITPWGKMNAAWGMLRAQAPVDAEHARLAWACTSCYACRERCEHQNPVARVLGSARAEAYAAGVAPAAARRVAARHTERLRRWTPHLAELAELPGVNPSSAVALVIGCSYLALGKEARDIVLSAVRLVGAVRLVEGCCGAPLEYAGDESGFQRARQRLLDACQGCKLLVADPGCAVLLGPGRSVTPVELAARQLESFKPISFAEAAPLRWHDPCQLGRGLGQYQAPRAVLTRLLGGAPEEFICRREHASCSGAGALLPLTMPRHAARIADARIAEHRRLGGGTIVTACGSALRRFRARGAPALDLVTLMRRSLVGDG